MSDFTTSAAPAATPAPTSTPDALSLDALKAVADLLGGGEVVAYRPVFAHVFGGATPALLLSQFWFWTNTPTVKGRDGWFYKTQREITQETGLTRRETDTARRKLVALGVLSENLRGVPATQHYHLHKERLYQLLWEHLEKQKASEKTDTSQFAQKRQTGLHKSAKQACAKPPNYYRDYIREDTKDDSDARAARSAFGFGGEAQQEDGTPEGRERQDGERQDRETAGRVPSGHGQDQGRLKCSPQRQPQPAGMKDPERKDFRPSPVPPPK